MMTSRSHVITHCLCSCLRLWESLIKGRNAVKKSPRPIMSCSAETMMLSGPRTLIADDPETQRTSLSILRRKLSTMPMRVLMVMTPLRRRPMEGIETAWQAEATALQEEAVRHLTMTARTPQWHCLRWAAPPRASPIHEAPAVRRDRLWACPLCRRPGL